ncbi:MAG: MvaI/BcnI family restriction endonuclease [Thermoplasmata archaeon]
MVLKEVDIAVELRRIERMGFIRTLKSGDTGVGYTLETLLGLPPTNKRGIADFSYNGRPIELKSQRLETQSMTTLFACEPATRTMNDYQLVQKFGYMDEGGRKALYVTLGSHAYVPQGLRLRVEGESKKVCLVDRQGGRIWEWDYSQFSRKIGNLLVVKANTRGSGKSEEFHYSSAKLCLGLDEEKFTTVLIDTGLVTVDIRAHVKPGRTSARNHGTAFRIRNLGMLESCYETVEALLGG